jgi:hypothetical protein
VERTYRYAVTTKLKRNAADGLFTKPSTLSLVDVLSYNTEKFKENQVPDDGPAKKGFDGL